MPRRREPARPTSPHSVVVCPLTATLRDEAELFCLDVLPSARNGLRELSQIAIDKLTVAPTAKIGAVIGGVDDAQLTRVTQALAPFLGVV
jgi:mRNA interferase MazF